MRTETYRPSGRMGPLSLPAGLAAGGAVAVAGGLAYQKLIDVIPFIYVNALLTLGFAWLIGYVVARTLTWSKMRSTVMAGVIGGVCGAFAVGFTFHVAHGWHTAAWAESAARAYALDQDVTADRKRLATTSIRSMSLGDYLDVRVETGWTVGPIEITGLAVWIIWLIEAGVLCAGAAHFALEGATTPFCERCDTFVRETRIGTIRGMRRTAFSRAARTGGIPGVLALEEGGGDARLALTMRSCPRCDRTKFVHGVCHWIEKSGRESKERDEVLLPNVVPTREDLDALAERFPPRAARRGPTARG